MSEIEIGPDIVRIDAEIVASALNVAPRDLQQRMREGTITSRFERGEGEDAGRVRLTFFSDTRRARITADTTGAVLSCSAENYAWPPRKVSPTGRLTEDPGAAIEGSDRNRRDAQLDAALQGTFPASDPIALSFDSPD